MISFPQHPWVNSLAICGTCETKHGAKHSVPVEGRFVAAVPGYNRQAGLPDACPIHKAWIPSWRNAGTEPGLETPDIGSLAQYVLLHLGCYPHLGRLKVCMPRKEMHKFQGTTLNSKLSIRYQEVYGFHQVISSHRSKFCIDHSWLYSI